MQRGSRSAATRAVGALLAGVAAVALAASPAEAASITSAGPLTQISTTADLNCAVNHAGDASGEWYGETACGTFVAVGGVLYGPAGLPAGSSASPRTAWTPVSQTTGGAGTAGSPFTITTDVTGGPVQVHQVDAYVVGQESYRTTVTVTNTSTSQLPAVVYRAGDCFLANSDTGFGRVTPEGAGTSVACVESVNNAPGARIEQLLPLTAGSRYLEAEYSEVWAAIGSQQPLPDTCRCGENIDNGIGLSWSPNLEPGVPVSFSELTTFSPAGVVPVVAAKTADTPTVLPGAADGYTVTFHNANAAAATLDNVADTLPAGFNYTTGSTTGAITTNPTVAGQTLTWTGPFTVPAGGDLTFHFGVTVTSVPGLYTNSVTAASGTATVVPALDTAAIAVGDVVVIPLVPLEGIPVALATVALVGAVWLRTRRRAAARA